MESKDILKLPQLSAIISMINEINLKENSTKVIKKRPGEYKIMNRSRVWNVTCSTYEQWNSYDCQNQMRMLKDSQQHRLPKEVKPQQTELGKPSLL